MAKKPPDKPAAKDPHADHPSHRPHPHPGTQTRDPVVTIATPAETASITDPHGSGVHDGLKVAAPELSAITTQKIVGNLPSGWENATVVPDHAERLCSPCHHSCTAATGCRLGREPLP